MTKLILPILAGLVGIIGTLTGLVAVVRHLKGHDRGTDLVPTLNALLGGPKKLFPAFNFFYTL